MDNPKKRRWIKLLLGVLLAPVGLFALLMVLLYVPPVQNFIRRQATALASEATGMSIGVERIDLRFPLNLLVSGVQVLQPADSAATSAPADTLLRLGRLDVRVQALPLFRGKVEVDGIALEQVSVNSARLLRDMQVRGTLGRFFLTGHGIDLHEDRHEGPQRREPPAGVPGGHPGGGAGGGGGQGRRDRDVHPHRRPHGPGLLRRKT